MGMKNFQRNNAPVAADSGRRVGFKNCCIQAYVSLWRERHVFLEKVVFLVACAQSHNVERCYIARGFYLISIIPMNFFVLVNNCFVFASIIFHIVWRKLPVRILSVCILFNPAGCSVYCSEYSRFSEH
jgi:hypothetical protein